MRRVARAALALVLLGGPALAQSGPPPDPAEAERLLREGTEARRQGRVDEALRALRRAAELDPDNSDAQVQLGLALTASRRFEEARSAFRRALERAPGYVDARIGLARTYFFENRFAEAERELRTLESGPGDGRAEARQLAEHIARAREAAERAAAERRPAPERSEQEVPPRPNPTAGRPAEKPAEDPAAAERRRSVAEVERLLREGRGARDKGQAGRAAQLLARAVALAPDNADAQVLFGLALIAQGRLPQAERAFRAALARAPDYADARVGLARLAFFRKDYAAAERELKPALDKAPDNRDAKTLRDQITRAREAIEAEARARAEAERQAEAERRRRAAIEAERRRAAAALAAATAARRAGRFAEAEQFYRTELRRRPADVDLLVNAGTVSAFQGPARFADARRDFERALALTPRSPDARLGLARLDLFESNLASAEARVAGVIAEAPANVEARTLLARIRLAQGDAEGAEVLFRQLAEQDPSNADAAAGLGDALRAQLRDDAALAEYRRASALDPASPDIRSRLEARPRPRWRLDLDGAYSDLTDANAPWREGTIRLAYQLSPRTTLSAGAEASERFERRDVLLDARIDHRWSDAFATYLRIGGTPQADFRPKVLAETGATLRLREGSGAFGPTLATLDLGFARYAGAKVQTARPGLQQYLLDGRLWFTGQAIATWAENTDPEVRARQLRDGRFGGDVETLTGYLVRVDAHLTERITAFLGYANAPDASDGRVFKTRSLFGGIEFALDERVSVRISGSKEDRKDSYDRNTFGVGVTTRF